MPIIHHIRFKDFNESLKKIQTKSDIMDLFSNEQEGMSSIHVQSSGP